MTALPYRDDLQRSLVIPLGRLTAHFAGDITILKPV
ncbi:Uncharacterised protein [Klebsiella pneumoniae subsp. ozaenae]|uniref:Uncharacterized protein n=1 Tax=Klebsiella pneumoniae subsp. ozaenae TaxID=574 RepID=A0A378BWP2_KLEPO|nr:Uncharacterised protein [Klebsiella pneumoniae subsp. ozaenae]